MPNFTLALEQLVGQTLKFIQLLMVNKTTNTNLVTVEGMSQINNTENASSFQFAIGIFIDNQLKSG